MSIGAATFLQPALQPVFDLICSEGVELFVKYFKKTDSELAGNLENWESELLMINDVLDDAVAKQFQSKAVQRWLQDLQDLAFDMEDILSDFAIEAQEHEFKMNSADKQDDGVFQGLYDTFSNMVIPEASTSHNTSSPSVQTKIEDINTRLVRIQSRTKLLNLSMTTNMQRQTLQTEALKSPDIQRESGSTLTKSKIFGRDDTKQEIINRLLNDDDSSNGSYVVIPIVGSGGIGKTTLAQCVYNDEQLKGHFNLKAWVCVSDVFDVTRITTAIVRATTVEGTHVECGTLEEAQTQLKKNLTRKKILIVLDDIWSDDYTKWECLQTPFEYAGKGSKVIMTTRNEGIARMMISHPMRDNTIVGLKGLSEDDCWNLFQQHVSDVSDLADMRDDIIEKCKGLPLAAKALGGLFRKTGDKRRRQMILESNVWSEDSGVLSVLRLSYDYLPSHLKRVFAYCSLVPKDWGFEKMNVILLWMAQGFLPGDDERMEDVGYSYFGDLESRSLFEKCPDKEGIFIMHDLVHDLALRAAGGICYTTGGNNLTHVDGERIRHVFLTKDATMESQLKASHLRTFYDDRFNTNLDFIQRFSYVRTLRLVSNTIKVLPECIGVLKHLRFLSLECESITKLPESINCLWNLQTLVLKGCRNLKKPPYIGSLKKLRYLEHDKNLVEMPRGFEKLTSLRGLDSFKLVDGHGYRIKELKNLNHLQGQLRISGLENVSNVEDAKEAQLHQKSGLNVLHLKWGTIREEQVDYNTVKGVVEELKPATSMKRCILDGYMGLILPGWLGDPSFNNIVTIKLLRCKKCDVLPPLGKLPCLKILHIEDMEGLKRVGVEFYGCSNPFPALEFLYFNYLKCWEKWEHIAFDRAFPCLQSLKIYDCGSLQGNLPPFLPSLKTLEIQRCRKLRVSVSLPNLPLLEELTVFECKSVSITTEDVKQGVSEEGNTPTELVHRHLTNLSIKNCPDVISFPEHLLFPALKKLQIHYCVNMESLPSGMHNLERLDIMIYRRPIYFLEESLQDPMFQLLLEIAKVPTEEDINLSLPSASLSTVEIRGVRQLKNLSVVDGTNLKNFEIVFCQKLESLVVGNFNSLSRLKLECCPKLQSLPPLSPTFISTLYLYDLGSCTDAIEQIPGPNLDLPSSLRELTIGGFKNLKTITCSILPNLWSLHIKYCPKFESFGDTALPSHLKQVIIIRCELIKPHLQSDPHNGVIMMDGYQKYSLC